MNRLKKVLLISMLVGISTTTFAGRNQCPASSAFSHEGPGYLWKVNENGWEINQHGSVIDSPLKNIPYTAKSYVVVYTDAAGNGRVECSYAAEGMTILNLIRSMPVSKDELSPQFMPVTYPNSDMYSCDFTAGDPSSCFWGSR